VLTKFPVRSLTVNTPPAKDNPHVADVGTVIEHCDSSNNRRAAGVVVTAGGASVVVTAGVGAAVVVTAGVGAAVVVTAGVGAAVVVTAGVGAAVVTGAGVGAAVVGAGVGAAVVTADPKGFQAMVIFNPAVEEPVKEVLGVNLTDASDEALFTVLAGVMEKSLITPQCATVSKAKVANRTVTFIMRNTFHESASLVL
jgi:hypothetical protein